MAFNNVPLNGWPQLKNLEGITAPKATADTAGIVKPDGETIVVDNNGVISSTCSTLVSEVFDNSHLLHQEGITISKTKTMSADAWLFVDIDGMAADTSFKINNVERLWIDGFNFRDHEIIPVYSGDVITLSCAAAGTDDNIISSIIIIYGLNVPAKPTENNESESVESTTKKKGGK